MTTIFCVDDNPDLVELLAELLKMTGYEVRTAPGGAECLRMLEDKGFHPDLILLDIMMEPVDGWETLRSIRDNPKTRDIPVAMLTGKHPTMSEAGLYGPMIDDYLMKPYYPRQIDEVIRHILVRADHVREVIHKARDHGVEGQVLSDYQRLASTVEVLKKFKEIIGTIEPFHDDLISNAEDRFAKIREQFAKSGVQA